MEVEAELQGASRPGAFGLELPFTVIAYKDP